MRKKGNASDQMDAASPVEKNVVPGPSSLSGGGIRSVPGPSLSMRSTAPKEKRKGETDRQASGATGQ